jgi:hypothetical protein
MLVDSRSFPESICASESKSIRDQGGRHKLLLLWNPNVTGTNATPFLFMSIVPKQQNRTHVSII